MNHISFSDLTASNKVLPDVVSSNTGGMTTIYESKGGNSKTKTHKSKMSRREKKKRHRTRSNMNGGEGGCATSTLASVPKMRGGKSKKSKSRRCKNKVINIYM